MLVGMELTMYLHPAFVICSNMQIVVNLDIGDFGMFKRSGLDYVDGFDETLSIQAGYWRISEARSQHYGRSAWTIDVKRTAPDSGSLRVLLFPTEVKSSWKRQNQYVLLYRG